MLTNHKKEDYRINIEFLTWPIIRYKREVLFGVVDLLVSFGGIAGLFLGFSLLSGVEILYYFTIRAGCMFVKNRVNVDTSQTLRVIINIYSLSFLCLQETLYTLQNEKESRPQTRYDLSLEPNWKNLTRGRRSLSMTNIQIVKPVEHGIDVANNVKISDGLLAPIKIRNNNTPMRGRINRLDVLGRLPKDVKHVSEKKKKRCFE